MSEIWNNVAGEWERNADFVDGHLAGATEALLDAAQIGVGDEVLDLATGPGGAGIAAARRVGDSGHVVLADDAPAMVEAAARRTAAMPEVDTLLCDQAAIEAFEASFDAVICRHGLMFAEEAGSAVGEAGRVLRPGRRYAAMTWDARAANPWLGLILDSVGEQFGVPFPPPGIPGPFSLDDPERLTQALQDGGLEDVSVERVATPMHAASLEAWWDLVPQLAGPLSQALAGMAPADRDSIHDRALESGERQHRVTDDGIELDGSVLIGTGRRP